MMDAPRFTLTKPLLSFTKSLSTLVALLALTTGSESFGQEEPLVPPSPTPAAATKPADAKPPLPPRVIKAMKPELPENAVAQPQKGEKTLEDGRWKIQITPRKSQIVKVNEKDYEKIYNSIPYRRSEYLANPSYRHDTTVEIMFGQMRNMVVHRNDTPQRVVNPRPNIYEPRIYREMEFWNYPGRFFRYLPGLTPLMDFRF